MKDKKSQDIGLLKHQIISPVLIESGRHQMNYFRSIENKEFDVPGVGLRKFKATTMKGWLNSYRKYGYSALMPKSRNDKGSFRKLTPESKSKIKDLRKEFLDLPSTLFYDRCIEEEILSKETFCYSSFTRFLKQEGLFKKRTAKPRKRYEMSRFGELWVGDFCHGPKINKGTKQRKAILFAIIDDYSRYIVGAKFAFSESTFELEDVFKDSILSFGLPDRLYVDNGPSFSSQYLAQACAHLQIGLIHSKPYDSPSRGKIERFFRTVRTRFLSQYKTFMFTDLKHINEHFSRWLRDDYHHKIHTGINGKPIERYQQSISKFPPKRVSKESIDEHFMVSVFRTVKKDSTISIEAIIYEVPTNYIGSRIEARYVQGDKSNIYLYEDKIRICEIKPVDSKANARNYRPTERTNALSFHKEDL